MMINERLADWRRISNREPYSTLFSYVMCLAERRVVRVSTLFLLHTTSDNQAAGHQFAACSLNCRADKLLETFIFIARWLQLATRVVAIVSEGREPLNYIALRGRYIFF